MCDKIPNYRLTVLKLCPNLTKLDDKDVTERERRDAQQVELPFYSSSSPPESPLDNSTSYYYGHHNGYGSPTTNSNSNPSLSSSSPTSSSGEDSTSNMILRGLQPPKKPKNQQRPIRAFSPPPERLKNEDHLGMGGVVVSLPHLTPDGHLKHYLGANGVTEVGAGNVNGMEGYHFINNHNTVKPARVRSSKEYRQQQQHIDTRFANVNSGHLNNNVVVRDHLEVGKGFEVVHSPVQLRDGRIKHEFAVGVIGDEYECHQGKFGLPNEHLVGAGANVMAVGDGGDGNMRVGRRSEKGDGVSGNDLGSMSFPVMEVGDQSPASSSPSSYSASGGANTQSSSISGSGIGQMNSEYLQKARLAAMESQMSAKSVEKDVDGWNAFLTEGNMTVRKVSSELL
jgi:hypothetical protein